MKLIDPISVWHNGNDVEVSILDVKAMDVQLDTSALFFFSLYVLDENGKLGEKANAGSLVMDGEDYQNWDKDSFAWDWVAEKLKLTIKGEYVLPVVETI